MSSKKPLVCASCGYEGEDLDMTKPCPSCRSIRVVLRDFLENAFGSNWRDYIAVPPNKAGEHDKR